jgi:hypothetical protein
MKAGCFCFIKTYYSVLKYFQFQVRCRETHLQSSSSVHLPVNPFLTKLGYGISVSMFLYEGSPAGNKFRPPWAGEQEILKTMKLMEHMLLCRGLH